LLSDNPDRYADAPLHAIRELLGIGAEARLPNARIHSVKMGTTLATNALLERKGARVGLLITKGFADLLEIGYQDRPDIFALRIEKPETLYAEVREIEERVLANGTVRQALREESVNEALSAFREAGVEAVAILFFHSYAFPAHELRAGELARDAGFSEVSLSHKIAREIKAVGRGDTATTNAYLNPLLRRHVEDVRSDLGAAIPLRFMQSNGGLTDADRFIGKNAVLSGPAGGVVAYAHVCQLAGFPRAIGFDMGGTSTDVSRHDGRFERVFEKRVAGVRLKAPMLHIETVAAGGGSILRFDGQRFAVGPESAGARPGPACYRLGGPATVTDANLVLGRIQPGYFPKCFGASGDSPLDAAAAWAALEALTARVNETTASPWPVEAVAAGFIRVANENMVQPIKKISVARGYDVREYALACFGGAGAQHACAIAGALGIATVMLHPYAGVLSAYGMGLADMVHTEVEAVLEPLGPEAMSPFEARFATLEAVGREALDAEGFPDGRIEHARSADLRYAGADTFLNVPCGPVDNILASFEPRHAGLYGFAKAGHPVEVVNIRTETIGHTDKTEEPHVDCEPRELSESIRIDSVPVFFATGAGEVKATDTPVYHRSDLKPGHRLRGPALIVEEVSTIVVDPGWDAEVNGYNHLVLTVAKIPSTERLATDCDPVMLEVFNSLFMSIAEQMGKILERVSHSANIKERLDFSCAVFSPDGELVANAPHMPVHLGAMGESVKAILGERAGSVKAGDVFMTNDPYHGGSHLPDITLVTPVMGANGAPAFFVANRGHHADIGGITPGSMPPFSTRIEEEGVVVHNFRLVSEGVLHEEGIVRLLTKHPYPARNVDERLSDLRAQIASNNAGVRLLEELSAQYGAEVVHAYMRHVRENAASAMRDRLARLPDGEYSAELPSLAARPRLIFRVPARNSKAISMLLPP
jgi:5-oxoprolinase (ATP-hydrolysing)